LIFVVSGFIMVPVIWDCILYQCCKPLSSPNSYFYSLTANGDLGCIFNFLFPFSFSLKIYPQGFIYLSTSYFFRGTLLKAWLDILLCATFYRYGAWSHYRLRMCRSQMQMSLLVTSHLSYSSISGNDRKFYFFNVVLMNFFLTKNVFSRRM
jgi:hypothetical protein